MVIFEIHAMDTGRERTKTKYIMTTVTKFKQWDQSFVMVRDGFIHDMSLKSTNWRRELGDLYQYAGYPEPTDPDSPVYLSTMYQETGIRALPAPTE